jgi:hypothetical protein
VNREPGKGLQLKLSLSGPLRLLPHVCPMSRCSSWLTESGRAAMLLRTSGRVIVRPPTRAHRRSRPSRGRSNAQAPARDRASLDCWRSSRLARHSRRLSLPPADGHVGWRSPQSLQISKIRLATASARPRSGSALGVGLPSKKHPRNFGCSMKTRSRSMTSFLNYRSNDARSSEVARSFCRVC